MPNWPCKNCTERYVGCHSKCKAYMDIKESYDDKRQSIYDSRQLFMESVRASWENKNKTKRRSGKK